MYVNTKQNTLVALQKTSTCVYVLSFTSKQSSFQLFLVDLLIISPAVDMDFFLLPLEWWEDGSTGFPPEAWEPDPTHFDGHTVCANCGFILNGKVVAHYFAEPISMNHPPRPSLWGPIFANTMPWLLLTTETSEQANLNSIHFGQLVCTILSQDFSFMFLNFMSR